ncbi:terminase small subunit [uncultured Clostridium sp.]|uniref:terminase small subunit n=1 Tax=uncultured Clostridium sp. TaxID=59620 RepID=UPI0028F12950|nr:terminase small subunit [uncultured Clostridium sp.]
MARQRSPARDEAERLYLDSKGTMKLVDIAATLNLKDSQIRKWKSQDNWDNKLNGNSKGALPNFNSNVTNQKVTKNNTKKEPIADEVKEVMENDELNDKQRLFCSYYVKYRNKTKAYMKAYKCSWENANSHAYELWKNVGVRNEIDRQLKELRDNIKIDIQDLIQLNADIAFADMKDYVEFGQEEIPVMGPFGPVVIKEKGKPPKEVTKVVNVVRFKESSEVDGTIISEIKQGKDGASIKLQDKMKAIDFLDRHLEDLDENTKRKLAIEHMRLQNVKLEAEIAKHGKGLDNELKIIVDYGDADGSS